MTAKHRYLVASAVIAIAAIASACYTTGTATVSASSGEPVEAHLALVGNGVYVVENNSRAVFFRDGYYWYYGDGIWFRSYYYDGNFVRVNVGVVPRAVLRIDRPARYRHYRARSSARRRAIRSRRSVHRARVRDRRHERRRHNHRDDRAERRRHRRDRHD